jgi:uncharacterized protein (DUF2235 family)
MKRLVMCCDGTWNRADQVFKDGKPCVTNVLKTAVRVAKRDGDILQIVYYDQGVGTGNLVDRVVGGATGKGLEDNIYDAYRFLVANYEPGDEIYLFGFSRGAFTARSIGGMIRKCGILRREHADRYASALALYHSDAKPGDETATRFRADYALCDEVPIQCIGVWDTVGALGIPLRGVRALQRDKFEFYDTELSSSVKYAYHALAIDERRAPFRPTLWDCKPKPGQTLEQVWFCGVHSDIGGGYEHAGLSDIALEWMLRKAEGTGLALDAAVLKALPLSPDPLMKPMNESRDGIYRLNRPYDRPVGAPTPDSRNVGPNGLDPTQSVHPSVLARWDAVPDYRPPMLREYLKRVGDARAGR